MPKPVRFAAVALLLAACAETPTARWTDGTGAGRAAADFERDRHRCELTRAGAGLDPRDRLKADDCGAARAASVSCLRAETAQRTDARASEDCLRAAGWVRGSGGTDAN